MMTQDVMKETARAVAIAQAMAGVCVNLPHGTRLFHVEKGWQAQSIADDLAIANCDTLLSFESALQDEEIKVIFIPGDAIIADVDIERICQRNAVVKTIFREVEAA